MQEKDINKLSNKVNKINFKDYNNLQLFDMEMLNRIVKLVIEAANELEEHKNVEAYNGANAYGDGTVFLHAVGNLLKNGDEIVKFARRIGRSSLYGMF